MRDVEPLHRQDELAIGSGGVATITLDAAHSSSAPQLVPDEQMLREITDSALKLADRQNVVEVGEKRRSVVQLVKDLLGIKEAAQVS
jgi:hypothetical protein